MIGQCKPKAHTSLIRVGIRGLWQEQFWFKRPTTLGFMRLVGGCSSFVHLSYSFDCRPSLGGTPGQY